MMKNGVFYFGIPSFVPEIFKFFCLKNDVTKMGHFQVPDSLGFEVSLGAQLL